MDFSSVHQIKSKNMKRGTSNKTKNMRKNKHVKVVYISTPMKVNTSASNFRALVQELTGRDSDVSRYMDLNVELSDTSQLTDTNPANSSESSERNEQILFGLMDDDDKSNVFRPIRFDSFMGEPHGDSPTSSESLFEPFDDVFSSQIGEKLEEMFPTNLFNFASYTSNGLDVLGDYDAL